MKKILLFFIVSVFYLVSFAQIPEGINYQTVIRDADGLVLANSNFDFRINIIKTVPDGEIVYGEIHNVTSNDFGVVNIIIGNGTPEVGEFNGIHWGEGEYFFETSVDQSGNREFQVLGITQFLSVPYSFMSANADIANGVSLSAGGQEYLLRVDEFGGLYTEKGDFSCGGILYDGRDGQAYQTVLIDDQCWMQQNLNFESDSSWCYEDDPANCEVFGRLYEWNKANNVCPEGWRLPTNDEWCSMLSFLDPTVDCEVFGFTGTDAGGKIKSTGTLQGGDGLWSDPNVGATNESGFSALPAGYRHYGGNGSFTEIYNSTTFWTATPHGWDWPHFWRLYHNEARAFHASESWYFGFSVRCVLDK